jgi:hypothetical protein
VTVFGLFGKKRRRKSSFLKKAKSIAKKVAKKAGRTFKKDH